MLQDNSENREKKISIDPTRNLDASKNNQIPDIPQLWDILKAQIQRIDAVNLRFNQLNQIIDQYRLDIYNQELRTNLLIKMLEEKNIFAPEEFLKRWPIYLKNDIGVQGPDGAMEGSLKVTFYGSEDN